MPASSLLDILGVQPSPAVLAKSAVIIVDAQREYLDGNVPLKGIQEALVEIKRLLEKARSLSVPIFHVAHNTQANAAIFAPESPHTEIIEEVKPKGQEKLITKNFPSAFVNTDLQKYLKETGTEELVIAGFMTHMCINATTRSAFDHGYRPTVIASACATRDLPLPDGTVVPADSVHRSNLASLADLLACVCNSSDDLK